LLPGANVIGGVVKDAIEDVIPAKAGSASQQREALVIHLDLTQRSWIPAFAGMTAVKVSPASG